MESFWLLRTSSDAVRIRSTQSSRHFLLSARKQSARLLYIMWNNLGWASWSEGYSTDISLKNNGCLYGLYFVKLSGSKTTRLPDRNTSCRQKRMKSVKRNAWRSFFFLLLHLCKGPCRMYFRWPIPVVSASKIVLASMWSMLILSCSQRNLLEFSCARHASLASLHRLCAAFNAFFMLCWSGSSSGVYFSIWK